MATYESLDDMQAAIVAELTTELEGYDHDFRADILALKVKDAVNKFKEKRGYINTSFTEEQIAADAEQFFGTIKEVALVNYGKLGAYGELYHYENTVHRSWPHERDLWQAVPCFVKVL